MKRRAKAVLARPGPAHIVRAWKTYSSLGGDRLAASIALPGFLAFFPLVALGFAVLGYVVDGRVSVQGDILKNVSGYLPGLLCSHAVPGYACSGQQIDVATIAQSKAGAGAIGIVGLLVAGLGWMGALRNALQIVFDGEPAQSNVIKTYARNITQLVSLGLGLLASVAVGGVAGTIAGTVAGWISLDGTLGSLLVRVVGIAVSLGVNVVLFFALFRLLGRWQQPVWRGALAGAVGLGLLQQVGAFYLKGTTGNPVYGSFAVVVGLLVWLVLVSRWTLGVAVWTRVAAGPLVEPEVVVTEVVRERRVPAPGFPAPVLIAFAAAVGALAGRRKRSAQG